MRPILRFTVTVVAGSTLGLAIWSCDSETGTSDAVENSGPPPSRIQTPGVGDEPLQAGPGTELVTLQVAGMTCAGCASTVNSALRDLEGVRETRVSFQRGLAWVLVAGDGSASAEELAAAITDSGYEAEPAESEFDEAGPAEGDDG